MFRRWIGSSYGNPSNLLNGLRLMIVGESHYPDASNPHLIGQTYPEQTQKTIEADAINEPYLFFKKLTHLVTGEQAETWSTERNNAFWQSVAFYNFVPVFIAGPPKRKRPKVREWRAGKAPFLEVLAEAQPEILIVCGLGLWWYVMDAMPGGVASNLPRRDTAQIGTGIGLRIPHPTGAWGLYSYETSRRMFLQLLSERTEVGRNKPSKTGQS